MTEEKWTATDLATIHTGYRTTLKEYRIKTTKEELVLLKPILDHAQQLPLNIFPKPLQRKVFSHFYDGHTGSHMGEYRTLYLTQLRFFSAGLRTDVTERFKCCAHFLSYNVWRNCKQWIIFSSPVTIPLFIMHVDLWYTGIVLLKNSSGRHPVNAMCD